MMSKASRTNMHELLPAMQFSRDNLFAQIDVLFIVGALTHRLKSVTLTSSHNPSTIPPNYFRLLRTFPGLNSHACQHVLPVCRKEQVLLFLTRGVGQEAHSENKQHCSTDFALVSGAVKTAQNRSCLVNG